MKCLLIYPNPESALNEEAGKMLLEQYEDYFSRAQMMTEIHARPHHTTSSRTEHPTSSGGAAGSGGTKEAGKKRPMERREYVERKKDKKKALKRL